MEFLWNDTLIEFNFHTFIINIPYLRDINHLIRIHCCLCVCSREFSTISLMKNQSKVPKWIIMVIRSRQEILSTRLFKNLGNSTIWCNAMYENYAANRAYELPPLVPIFYLTLPSELQLRVQPYTHHCVSLG